MSRAKSCLISMPIFHRWLARRSSEVPRTEGGPQGREEWSPSWGLGEARERREARGVCEEQTENLSLPTQLRACEEYCRREGYEVLERFREEGESAKTADRPQLQGLLKYCRTHKGKVHFVVVFNLTRFAREKYDHFALRSHLKSLGISLRSATEPTRDSQAGAGGPAAAARTHHHLRHPRRRGRVGTRDPRRRNARRQDRNCRIDKRVSVGVDCGLRHGMALSDKVRTPPRKPKLSIPKTGACRRPRFLGRIRAPSTRG
jgi:hypothetical protein